MIQNFTFGQLGDGVGVPEPRIFMPNMQRPAPPSIALMFPTANSTLPCTSTSSNSTMPIYYSQKISTSIPVSSLSTSNNITNVAKMNNISPMKDRTKRKPIMEKQRRDRINLSLDSLKKIILINDPQQNSKLEKADILEKSIELFNILLKERNHHIDKVKEIANLCNVLNNDTYARGVSDSLRIVMEIFDVMDGIEVIKKTIIEKLTALSSKYCNVEKKSQSVCNGSNINGEKKEDNTVVINKNFNDNKNIDKNDDRCSISSTVKINKKKRYNPFPNASGAPTPKLSKADEMPEKKIISLFLNSNSVASNSMLITSVVNSMELHPMINQNSSLKQNWHLGRTERNSHSLQSVSDCEQSILCNKIESAQNNYVNENNDDEKENEESFFVDVEHEDSDIECENEKECGRNLELKDDKNDSRETSGNDSGIASTSSPSHNQLWRPF